VSPHDQADLLAMMEMRWGDVGSPECSGRTTTRLILPPAKSRTLSPASMT
jgi:hypothetical protein